MLRISVTSLLIACLPPQIAVPQTLGSDPATVELRSTKYPIDKYYVCLVAKSAYGERKWLRQGESISAYIRDKCGHADKDYIEIFQSIPSNVRNRVVSADGQLVANKDGHYIFPECLYARDWQIGLEGETPPTVPLKRKMSVGEIVDEYVGPRDDTRRREATRAIYYYNPEAVPRLRDASPSSDEIAKIEVSAQTEIKVPVLIKPRKIKLDLSVMSRAEFISQILTATDNATFRQFNKCATPDAFRVPLEPIPLTELLTQRNLNFGGAYTATSTVSAKVAGARELPPHGVAYCAPRTVEPLPDVVAHCDGETTDSYPVNWSAVTQAIGLEEAYSVQRGIATVILTDTGLQGLDNVLVHNSSTFPERFPSEIFFRIEPDEIDNEKAIGINWNKAPDSRYLPPFYYSKQPDMPHGTHIAGIVLGQTARGTNAETEDKVHLALLRERLKLLVVNVVKDDKTTDVCDRQFYISPRDIKAAIGEIDTLTSKGGLRIFNMSLETYETINRPSDSANHLIVAAAGNAGIDYGRSDQIALTAVYPAHWSSDRDNVISVGGHDASRQLVIGNSGRDEVHLAAPACKINSLIATDGGAWSKGEMTGTSQSAAHVTMAAALLYNLHLMTPQQIRWRLIDAADFEPHLETANFAGGLLNVGAALGATFDVVKLRDNNELLFGQITQPKLWACPPSSSPDASARQVLVQTGNVRRVSYTYEDAFPSTVHMLWGSRREPKSCGANDAMRSDFQSMQLEFREAVLVNEEGRQKVYFKDRPIPLSRIREIVPHFLNKDPAGPTLPN